MKMATTYKILPLILVSSTACANSFFVGADFGKTTLDIDSNEQSLHSGAHTSDKISGVLKTGFFVDQFRLYGALGGTHQSEEKSTSITSTRKETYTYYDLTFNLDYLFPTYQDFNLYLGPHLGFGLLQVDTKFSSINETDEIVSTGFVFGGQAGIIYDFNGHVFFELGYRYSRSNIQRSADIITAENPALTVRDVKFKIDSISRFYFAGLYRF